MIKVKIRILFKLKEIRENYQITILIVIDDSFVFLQDIKDNKPKFIELKYW